MLVFFSPLLSASLDSTLLDSPHLDLTLLTLSLLALPLLQQLFSPICLSSCQALGAIATFLHLLSQASGSLEEQKCFSMQFDKFLWCLDIANSLFFVCIPAKKDEQDELSSRLHCNNRLTVM